MRITIKRKNVQRWASLSALGAGAKGFVETPEAEIREVPIKRKNLRRWASISVLGAGALGLAGTAEADIVEVPVNESVGLGIRTSFLVNLPGGADLKFLYKTYHWTRRVGNGSSVKIYSHATKRIFLYATKGKSLARGAFSKGSIWGSATSSGTHLRLARRTNTHTQYNIVNKGTAQTAFGSPHNYFEFKFDDNGKTLYGWGELNVSVSKTSGPDVEFVEYAYDDTGAKIGAGVTDSPAPVPEPREAIPLALGALVLGASRVRRWRREKAG